MAVKKKSATLTPMMQQYRKAKDELSGDTILLFRMGDFYEMFFEDAEIGARLMEITLTKRNGIPMAGIPYHALQSYLPRILESGQKVAIAEQVEDPKEAKGLVKREITQIITPGTIVEGDLLRAGRSNFLVAVLPGRRDLYGLATLDISTGDFRVTQVTGGDALITEFHRLMAAECLVPSTTYREYERDGFPDAPTRMAWTSAEDWVFDEDVANELLRKHFDVASLDGFGVREYPVAVRAAGAILHYAQHNLRRDAAHVTAIAPYANSDTMQLDRISQRNLELVEPLFTDSRNATLLAVLDQTVTPMGSRLIRDWLLRPLLDRARIEVRQDAVQALIADQLLLLELREALAAVKDIERTIARLNVGSANARDLLVMQRSLEAIPGLKAILSNTHGSSLLDVLADALHDLPAVTELVSAAIGDEPPLTVKDGGIIRDGYDPYLDDLRKAATEGKGWIAKLQLEEQERTGVKSLKVRYNKVFGYYIELSKANAGKVPEDYIRKQTLVNAERFITPQLKEIEDKVLGSEDKSKALEYELFQKVRDAVTAETITIQASARAVAEIDALASLAEAALKNAYVRPVVTDDLVLDIRDGRHPVVDHFVQDQSFVPNDVMLDGELNRLAIITGPNMAGKSTYIRQVALLVLMAQVGSFVPASSATVGIADRIFTRVGAADDLSRGQSTFMVEMLETANILNNATNRSLIILDEIGRGTSTFDGLSIAWAVAEYIHDAPEGHARTLFATHYHELTELANTCRGVRNYHVAVREWGDRVIFLHKIQQGTADKSYGIHVARLAGLPSKVLDRAREVLDNLEGNSVDQAQRPKLARHKQPPPHRPATPEQPSLFDILAGPDE